MSQPAFKAVNLPFELVTEDGGRLAPTREEAERQRAEAERRRADEAEAEIARLRALLKERNGA